jgi:ABC-2 type transport system permease protein
MRSALAIAKKELNVYFTTPIAYVMFTVVALFGALFFNGALDGYRMWSVRAIQFQNPQALEHLNLTDMVVGRVFGSIGVFIIIAAPFLSMRLIAEEKRTSTFQLLMTAPVRPLQIVLGKYLAALGIIGVCVGIVAMFPLILSFFGEGSSGGSAVEWQTVLTGLLGLFLLGAMAMAVGLFISSLTESVIVAALVSLILLLGLWVVTIFAIGVEGPVKDFVVGISASEHLGSFLSGRIELKDIAYYLSFIIFGLFLTERSVEGHRWA